MLKIFLAAVLAVQTLAPFTVVATQTGRNTTVLVDYPPTDNIWSCVVSRRSDRSDTYEPRWCGFVTSRLDTVVIPNWPPNDGHDWEVMVFVQWRETPDQTENFGYRESDWAPIVPSASAR